MPPPDLPAQIAAVQRALLRTRRVDALLLTHGRMPDAWVAQDLLGLEAALHTLEHLATAASTAVQAVESSPTRTIEVPHA